ncbi:MAG TPA: phosphodiester glycosidase family protein [Methyloceanibacter sp.]|nr:phosphodiester glycosidase family protein [Methyloceanibacter sp.]
MPRFVTLALAILWLAATVSAASAEPCRTEDFRGASYIVCRFDPAKEDVRIVWRGEDGRPYRTFGALATELDAGGQSLQFAMNGGMYERDLSPVGLHIENGRALAKANTTTIKGRPSQIPNFYKKPNGIFYLGAGKAGILVTEQFLARRPKAEYATQSGPMLVIDGAIHPAFIVNSKDLKPRNGVGVASPTEIYFVISRGSVSFYAFARFFRDALHCDNALFLDGGTAPGLYAPELRRNDPPSHGGYGPIIAVVK